jgi:hypothetical protein
MLYRYSYLENAKVLGDSGEVTVDINVTDPITCLWVEVRNTNGGSYNHDNPMHDNISAIEVIDGADVLYSLDGRQAHAMACYDLKQWPHQRLSALASDVQTAAIPILFGRYPGDTEYAFDPKRFTNPQLRVKWNFATNNAVGATGFLSGSGRLTVIAEIMEGGPGPRGFLMKKEAYTYTTAVGTEYIDLPRDYPYRNLMFRAYAASTHIYEEVSKLKLNCDAGKFVPIDLDTEDYLYLMYRIYPRFSYRAAEHKANGATLYVLLKEVEDVALNPEVAGDVVASYTNYEYGNMTVSVYIAGATNSNNYNIGTHVHGYLPFGHLMLPFGDQGKADEWLPAPSFRSVRLEATGAAASAAAEVCLTQERAY